MRSEDIKKIRQELGEHIRQAREKAHLTQQDVVDMTGVSISYYAQIERGEVNPSFEKLHSITTALGIKALDMSPGKKKRQS